jgi:hypothetical protein
MPIIPATWEAEIVGSQLEASLDNKVRKALSKIASKIWLFGSVIPAMWEVKVGGLPSKVSPRQNVSDPT